MRVWSRSWNCPHVLIGIQISKMPVPVGKSNASPKRSKPGASAASCPESGSHLVQIVQTVRRMAEMCSRWANTAYFCSPSRRRLKAVGSPEKSATRARRVRWSEIRELHISADQIVFLRQHADDLLID